MKVQMYKEVRYEVANGLMEIEIINNLYELTYYNSFYKNSPFKLPTTFSTRFTIQEILASSEVLSFMSRFN